MGNNRKDSRAELLSGDTASKVVAKGLALGLEDKMLWKVSCIMVDCAIATPMSVSAVI